MRIIKLAIFLLGFYSCFAYSHDTNAPCDLSYLNTNSHWHTVGSSIPNDPGRCYYHDSFGPGNPPSEPENDCPPAGPVPNTFLSGHPSALFSGDTVMIDGCEYSIHSSTRTQHCTVSGVCSATYAIDSTGRSSDDITGAGETLPLETNAPSDFVPTPTPRDDSASSQPSTAVTSESSSSITNSDGSTTGSGTVSTITYNDDGTTTETTIETVTNTSSTGSTTGTTTTETSTTTNPNGASSTSTTVTETDGNGTSTVVSQSTRSNNEVVDEEGGSISGGKSCSAPPSRSGEVTDAEYNQILQTYYLRCPPNSDDLVSYKPAGFDQDSLESKVAQAEQEYTDFINQMKSEAESLFSISLNSSGQINKNIVSMRGAEVDFSLFRFMSELSIIGALIIALAYIRAFFIITSGEK